MLPLRIQLVQVYLNYVLMSQYNRRSDKAKMSVAEIKTWYRLTRHNLLYVSSKVPASIGDQNANALYILLLFQEFQLEGEELLVMLLNYET